MARRMWSSSPDQSPAANQHLELIVNVTGTQKRTGQVHGIVNRMIAYYVRTRTARHS
jgi:hypothetical protein